MMISMIKVTAVMLLASGTAFLPIKTSPQMALTPPSSYDWAYKYDTITNRFRWFYDDTSTPLSYGRTADGAYYNYEGSILYDEYAPFDITIKFRHSNTSWEASGTPPNTYYLPATNVTAIGSDNTTGTINKTYITIYNPTSHDFLFSYDLSTSNYSQFIVTRTGDASTGDYFYQFSSNSSLSHCRLRAFTTLDLYTQSHDHAQYIDALYIKDLGVSTTYLNGASSGYVDGASSGYGVGFSDGRASGLADNTGWDDVFAIMASAVAVVGDVLATRLFGAFTIGGLVSIPIIVGLLFWIINKWRGTA